MNATKPLITVASILLLSATPVHGHENAHPPEGAISLQAYCSDNPCRKDQQVRFLTDQGIFEQQLELYWPAVQDNQVSLLPGETILVEAEIQDDRFVNFRQVTDNTDPERTIVFDFQQREGEVDMRLSVKNPFNKRMKFHLQMIDFQGNPHQTSSCPVTAGGSVYESWPHPIPELIVSDFRVQSDSDGFSCEF